MTDRPAADRCGKHFTTHPTKPHLVAVCALDKGHDGDHDNRLPKPQEAILRNRANPGARDG